MASLSPICVVLFLQLCLTALVLSSRQPRAVTVGQQLKTLIDEERVLREKLESRVTALRTKAAALGTTIKPCTCPVSAHSHAANQSVAFSSTLHSRLTSMAKYHRYTFPNVLTNVGGAYNSSNGTFVAPVTGLYALSLTIYMPPGYYVGMDLMKEGQAIARVRTGHYSSRWYNMGTNFALTNMTAGERAWIEFGYSSHNYLYAEDVTTVTGYLLYQY